MAMLRMGVDDLTELIDREVELNIGIVPVTRIKPNPGVARMLRVPSQQRRKPKILARCQRDA